MAYKSLSTANLPNPVIDPNNGEEPRDYFETFIYIGNGTGLQVGDVIRKPAVTGIIDKSLIFDDGSNYYLSATAGSADTTFTVSMWFKRSDIPTQYMYLFSSANAGIALNNTTNRLYVYNGSGTGTHGRQINDNDWHHVVYSQSSGSYTLYLDGIQIGTGTGFTITTTANHINIGRYENSSTYYFDGYIADVNFVSGTALNATSFGAFDANGVWSPVEPSVTYGSSGYRLQFEDATSTTTLGNDTSGNNNDFTLNNMATTDQVPDSPTNNFATLYQAFTASNTTFSEGNLRATSTGSTWNNSRSTIVPKTGKWYAEVLVTNSGGASGSVRLGVGVAKSGTSNNVYLGSTVGSWSYFDKGNIYNNATLLSSAPATYQSSVQDVIGIALDLDSTPQTVTWYKNNTQQYAQDLDYGVWEIGVTHYGGGGGQINFGQSSSFTGHKSSGSANATDANGEGDFYYAPPSGYLAICENNITVDAQNLESPDWVWIKNRSATDQHQIYDTLRGVQKAIASDDTTIETEKLNGLVDFNKNGFTIGNDVGVNTSGEDYVAWCWKVGGTAASNTSGSITSSVLANQEVGFSILTYTGSGGASDTIGHGLSSAPEMIMIKDRDALNFWAVYHAGVDATAPEDYLMRLNTTDARLDGSGYFNDTAPTSTLFTVGTSSAVNNTHDYVAYCFHSVEGYSKIGHYIGNESATAGPFVYTGFRPAYLMIKAANTASTSWIVWDNKRTPNNSFLTTDAMVIDTASNQSSITDTTLRADFFSNGFVMYSGSNSYNNDNTRYIYMAFAEQPFKYANAR
jgi:hypothetical protein